MTDDQLDDVTSCKELDLKDGVPEDALSPDIHDFREVEQELILDLTEVSVYVIESECTHCNHENTGFDIIGDTPETQAEIRRIVYELYESFYENPRPISQLILMHLAADYDTGLQQRVAQDLAGAVDLGDSDGQSDHRKRSKAEVLDRVLSEDF